VKAVPWPTVAAAFRGIFSNRSLRRLGVARRVARSHTVITSRPGPYREDRKLDGYSDSEDAPRRGRPARRSRSARAARPLRRAGRSPAPVAGGRQPQNACGPTAMTASSTNRHRRRSIARNGSGERRPGAPSRPRLPRSTRCDAGERNHEDAAVRRCVPDELNEHLRTVIIAPITGHVCRIGA
jgi:hypothetical protein